jgi:predicted acetyltransferase
MASYRHEVKRPPLPAAITEASVRERDLVRNLLQLYLYEMTEYEPRDVEADGSFAYRYFDAYWSEPRRSVLVMRVGGRPTGFSMVNDHSVFSPGASGIRSVAEFFVLRGYRRLGLGTTLALETFRRYPGRWEVREMAANQPAIEFWRRVIGEYTGGRFVELELDDHRWRGPVQTFDNSLMVG